MLSKQLLEEVFGIAERCAPQACEGIGEIEQPAFAGQVENPNRAGGVQSFAQSRFDAFAVVHEQ